MPRILYIVPSDWGALKEKGVEAMLFERDERGFFERVVTVHPAARANRVIEFAPVFSLHELDPDPLGRALRSRALRALYSPLHLARVVLRCLKLVRREKIDLIRVQDPFWCGLAGLLVAALSRRPWCVSIHTDYRKMEELTGGGDSYTLFGLRAPAALVSRLVLSRAPLVLPVRESLAAWAKERGARESRVRVIPHGVDSRALAAGDLDARAALAIPRGRRIVSFVGRLCRENYLEDLVRVARLLALKRDDFCLVVAGGGDLEPWLREQVVAEPRLAETVRLVGFRSRALCFALRRRSAVSLCPMGGFSLIEAALAGSAPVAYRVDWHDELVVHGETGFLVEEGDVEGLARAVERCLDEPETAARLGRQARRLALARHDAAACSEKKVNCYRELLAQSKGEACPTFYS